MDLSRYTITGDKERSDVLKLQNERLIKLRWFYVGILGVIATISSIIASKPEIAYRYAFICLAALILNTLLFLLNRLLLAKQVALKALMLLQLALDLLIATVVVYEQGGLQARTTVLFALPIVSAGLIFSYLVVYYTAILSGIGYLLSVYLFSINKDMPLKVSDALVPLVFYPAFFIIFARLVVYLMRVTTEDTREKAYDAYLALLSHQLKHPVSTTSAIIDLIEHTSSAPPSEQKKYVQMLKHENQNLLLLLDNLLETAAPPSFIGPSDKVNLPKLIQEIAHLCAQTFNRTADLKLTLRDMSLDVNGNSERLRTAFADIINNAFEYSTAGTPVKVSVHKANKNVIISIGDKGRGVGKFNLRRLSGKYNPLGYKDQGIQGLGLGLEVAQKIIRDHYGSLHIVSDKSGTKVVIILKRGHKNE